jgi:hypothetical protein
MTRLLRFFCLIISVGLLAAGYYMRGQVWPVVGILIFGIIWSLGLVFRWDWVSLLGLYISFGVAAFGLILDYSTAIMISGALFALLTWDLAEFYLRLLRASPDDDTAALEKLHLLRVILPVLTGAILSALALSVHLKTSFEWLALLALFMVWGIGRVVTRLLRKL